MQIFFNTINTSITSVSEVILAMFSFSIITIFLMIYSVIALKTREAPYLYFSISLLSLFVYKVVSILSFLIYSNSNQNNEILTLLSISKTVISMSILIILTIIPISLRSFYEFRRGVKLNFNIIVSILSLISSLIFIFSFMFNVNYIDDVFVYTGNEGMKYELLFFGFESLDGAYLIIFTLFIILTSFIYILIDFISKKDTMNSIIISLGSILSIYILIESFGSYNLLLKDTSDRIFVSLFIFIITFYNMILVRFSRLSIEKITNQITLNNAINKNGNIINGISIIVNKMEKIDKNIKKVEVYIPDIIKESKDSIDIIKAKTDNLKESSIILSEENLNKENIIVKYNSSIYDILKSYENPRLEIENINTTFFDVTNEILTKSIASEKLENIIRMLTMTSKTFNENSDNILKDIYRSISRFENINQMTDSIYETISFVKDITSKTSLLSINAGIQASKAGNVGKSFAVVAKEIGTLATESLRGTEQVEKMLNDIFKALISVENSSRDIKKDCEVFRSDIYKMTENIEFLISKIEDYKINEPQKITNIKELVSENNNFIKTSKDQSNIINLIIDSIISILAEKSNLENKILEQKDSVEDIEKNVLMLVDLKYNMGNSSKELKEHTNNMHREILTLYMAIVENDSSGLKKIADNEEYNTSAFLRS